MKRLGVVLALVLVPSVAVACLWDYDTIKMERQRFPSTLELITGKFLRHSPEFYQWRITNRIKRLEANPKNIALLDDLAVAYDKTGQHDLAIQTAMRIEALQPNRYETASNLGTFEFHAGQLGKSLPHIDRALKIHPDAHFGREKYQKWLTEYVLKRREAKGSMELPLAEVKYPKDKDIETIYSSSVEVQEGFVRFLEERIPRNSNKQLSATELKNAVTGVQGMLRFANHESPILLEALGSLLMEPRFEANVNAKHLAGRAFLKAAIHSNNPDTANAYRAMAVHAIELQVSQDTYYQQMRLTSIESEFQGELAEAKSWYDELHAKELKWIREGRDVDTEFDKLYTQEPEITAWRESPKARTMSQEMMTIARPICLALAILGVSVLVIMRLTRKKR